MSAIQSMASQVLVNLSIGVITLLGAYALYYIKKQIAKVKTQTEQLKSDSERKLLLNALNDVEKLVTVTVGSIEQTTAAALRKAVKDGTTNRDELTALGQKAFNEVRAEITPEAQKLIARNFGSFSNYLLNLIETKVLEVKTSNGV